MEKILPHELLLNNNDISPIAMDVLDVLGCIYIYDISTPKNNENRYFDLEVPVSDPELWNNTTDLLHKLVAFVSSDELNIKFCYKNKDKEKQEVLFNDNDIDCITLLSGGLDSFCGAYYNIKNNIKSTYVGYANNPTDRYCQKMILELLREIEDCNSYMFDKMPIKKEEPTQRTRSLLFMALAVIMAESYNVQDIRIYENGILSLNPGLMGRYTTKTTHPKTIYLINQLLGKLNLNIIVNNPFIFYTKGQLVCDLSDNFKNMINNTTSCSTSNQVIYKENTKECGWCVPCLLRKIAISACDLESYDKEYTIGFGDKISDIDEDYKRIEYNSSLEYFKMFKKFIDNEEIYSYVDIHGQYFHDDDYLNSIDDMFKKFSSEVERFLEKNELY